MILYHATDRANRADILEWGLDPRSEQIHGGIKYPNGIYCFDCPYTAEAYAEWRFREWDIWEVDASGLRVYEDPFWVEDPDAVVEWNPDVRSVYLRSRVAPERLSLESEGEGDIDGNFG